MSGNTAGSLGHGPLHVVQLFADGGAVTGAHVRSLAAGLVARGVRVTVLAPAAAARRYALAATGARVAPLPSDRGPGAVRLARTVCAGADLVHAHGLRAGMTASLALRGRPVPLVVSWHRRAAGELSCPRLRRLAERWVLRSAAVVLGASPELVDRARRRGARDARLAPVALPVPRPAADPQERATAAQKVRAELGAFDRPLVLAAGPLTAGYGHETLLNAACGWRRRTPEPLLVIEGEGDRRAALESRVEREELPVVLLGRRDDVPRLLAAADVAVHAADLDDGPALLARGALSCGIPLVSTVAGGMAELAGDAAVLVPAGDPAALAAAIADLLDAPERRAELAAAGHRRAAAWPTEDSTVAHILSVYDEIT